MGLTYNKSVLPQLVSMQNKLLQTDLIQDIIDSRDYIINFNTTNFNRCDTKKDENVFDCIVDNQNYRFFAVKNGYVCKQLNKNKTKKCPDDWTATNFLSKTDNIFFCLREAIMRNREAFPAHVTPIKETQNLQVL